MKIVSYCSGSGVLPLPVNGDGQPTPTPQGRDHNPSKLGGYRILMKTQIVLFLTIDLYDKMI